MTERAGWSVFCAGLAATAAGLFLFPWLSTDSDRCNAIAGTSCTVSNTNSAAALALLVVAAALGAARWRMRSSSSVEPIALAATGVGIGFSVFTLDYDSFTPLPTDPFESWGPSTGFVLTLAGAALFVVAAVLWGFTGDAADRAGRRTRIAAAGAGAAAGALSLLGASLPWVHVSPATSVLDTDPASMVVPAALLIAAAAGYGSRGGRGWATALAIGAGVLATVAVYQWLHLRWQTADAHSFGDHDSVAAGIELCVAAAAVGAAAATVALRSAVPRRQPAAAGFLAALLAAVIVSQAAATSHQPSCGGAWVVGTDANGAAYSGCAVGSLYEDVP